MPDTVVTQIMGREPARRIIHMANISDGTGEALVKKLDMTTISAINPANGQVGQPVSCDIDWVRWAVQGFSSVRLYWDHTTDDLALVLSGNGYEDFDDGRGPLLDPRSAGGDGSLLLSTAGALAGATYDITLSVLFRF